MHTCCVVFACVFLQTFAYFWHVLYNMFSLIFLVCFVAHFFPWQSKSVSRFGACLWAKGPWHCDPLAKGWGTGRLIRRARATCMKAMYLVTLYPICINCLFFHVVQLLHQLSPLFALMTLGNWIAAEGQPWCHPGGVLLVPPNCVPSCLLWWLRACHLCKPSFFC